MMHRKEMTRFSCFHLKSSVMPAKAGIQNFRTILDSRFRGNDVRGTIAAIAIAVILSGASNDRAFAHSYKFGAIEVGHLWGPPAIAKNATETDIFGPVLNSGANADRLLSVSSPLAKRVEFRTGKGEAAVTAPIDLPPGKPVSLAPWGVHLRFIGLKHPLKEQEWVPVKLVFEKAGAHDAKVLIETTPTH